MTSLLLSVYLFASTTASVVSEELYILSSVSLTSEFSSEKLQLQAVNDD